MAKSYGEGFQQPLDWETGEPIPGSPRMGSPSTNRPWQAGGNGIVILPDDDSTLKSVESTHPSPFDPPAYVPGSIR